MVQRRSRYELKEADEEKGCADREGGREREREREKEGERRPALVPFKVCYLFKAVQTFTERWQPWNAEAGPRLRAAAVGNRCSPQPLQTRSPSGRVSTQTVPEICGPDSDRSRQQPHARTHTHTGVRTHTQASKHAHARGARSPQARGLQQAAHSWAPGLAHFNRRRQEPQAAARGHTHTRVRMHMHMHTHLIVD